MQTDPTRFDVVLDELVRWDGLRFMDKTANHVGDWHDAYASPTWSLATAVRSLGLQWVERTEQVEGYDTTDLARAWKLPLGATDGTHVWVNPERTLFPIKVAAHELAHALLGHSTIPWQRERMLHYADVLGLPRPTPDAVTAVQTLAYAQGETEAETTALLVTDALGYPNSDPERVVSWTAQYLRGYMPVALVDRDAVKRVAQQILSAGMVSVRKAA